MSKETFERKVATAAEREARKAFREDEATKALTEHEKAQNAFNENRERLKADGLHAKPQRDGEEMIAANHR